MQFAFFYKTGIHAQEIPFSSTAELDTYFGKEKIENLEKKLSKFKKILPHYIQQLSKITSKNTAVGLKNSSFRVTFFDYDFSLYLTDSSKDIIAEAFLKKDTEEDHEVTLTYISTDVQRCGIGSMLMGIILNHNIAQACNYSRIVLESFEESQYFYKKLDFVQASKCNPVKTAFDYKLPVYYKDIYHNSN